MAKKVVKKVVVNKAFAVKVLSIVDQGLVSGMGVPVPGKMCVEAAVAFASGEDHTDRPSCVHPVLHQEKIKLNDANGWDNDKTRAAGLRRVAIAQLGSAGFNKGRYRQLFNKAAAKTLIQACTAFKMKQLNLDLKYSENRLKEAEAEVKSVKKAIKKELARKIMKGTGLMMPKTARKLARDLDYYSNNHQQNLVTAAEVVTQVLKKMRVPGTKYLYLTETKPKTHKK